jgi:DNA repair protein RadC
MHPAFRAADQAGFYQARPTVSAEDIVTMARQLLNRRFAKGHAITSPEAFRDFLHLKLADREQEVFCCLFLDNRHRILAFEELFQGTIDAAAVYPREVAKRALSLNAKALILVHNHPSGVAEPSEADRAITHRIRQALDLLDVRVLDHFIIGDGPAYSFAEHGLL